MSEPVEAMRMLPEFIAAGITRVSAHPAQRIVLGVCGSVAAPKSQQIASGLVKAGYVVDVVLTESAKKYIGAYAFKGVVNGIVYSELFPQRRRLKGGEEHIELARGAACMVVAPATQSFISSVAYGDPKNPVSLVAMNVEPKKLLVCPAMSSAMWMHPSTQENISKLGEWGISWVGPVEGRLASGDNGLGRMSEPDEIVQFVRAKVGSLSGDLRGLKIVISAGGCRESIDAVRFLGNRSSGKQGHALAAAARDRGGEVVLITSSPETAPAALKKIIAVTDFASFKSAIDSELAPGQIYISAAAISDYRPRSSNSRKLDRGEGPISLELQPTEDLIASVSEGVFKVAFAAEAGPSYQENVERARMKLKKKRAQLIVLNSVKEPGAGFESETNRVSIISESGSNVDYPAKPGAVADKYDVANRILDQILLVRAK